MKKSNWLIPIGITFLFVIFVIAFPLPVKILPGTASESIKRNLKEVEINKCELIFEMGYKTATQRVLEGKFDTRHKRDSVSKADSAEFRKEISKIINK